MRQRGRGEDGLREVGGVARRDCLAAGLDLVREAGRETIPPGHAADFAEAILTAPALAHPDAVL